MKWPSQSGWASLAFSRVIAPSTLFSTSSFLPPSANVPSRSLLPGPQDLLLLLFLGIGSLWPLVCWAWRPGFFLVRESRVHPLGTQEKDLSRACGSQQGVWPSVLLSMPPHVAACPGVTPPSLPSPQALPLTLRPRQPRRAFLDPASLFLLSPAESSHSAFIRFLNSVTGRLRKWVEPHDSHFP